VGVAGLALVLFPKLIRVSGHKHRMPTGPVAATSRDSGPFSQARYGASIKAKVFSSHCKFKAHTAACSVLQ